MTMQRLFAGDFAGYFAEAGDANALWLMVHVPKTAGSSLSTDLGALLRPSYNINVRQTDPSLPHGERFNRAVAAFLAASAARPFRFVSGHIDGDHAQQIIAAHPQARAFAMLRHPVARMVSDYRYQRSPMHSAPEAFRARYPSFESFVHEHPARNKITRHLLPRRLWRTADPEACIAYLEKTYVFLGLQESYALSFQVLMRLMGLRAEPRAAVRVNTEDAESRVVLTPALEQAIIAKSTLDMAVFHSFSARLNAVGGALAAYLAQGAAAAG